MDARQARSAQWRRRLLRTEQWSFTQGRIPLGFAFNNEKRYRISMSIPSSTIYILPGGAGHSRAFWYRWLQRQLEIKGYKVVVCGQHILSPAIRADRLHAHYRLSEHDVIIGHSFGGLTALKWLEHINHHIYGLVLVDVSTFNSFKNVPLGLLKTITDKKKRKAVLSSQQRYLYSWDWQINFKGMRNKIDRAYILSEDGTAKMFPTWRSDHYALARKIDAQVLTGKGIQQHYTAQQESKILQVVLQTLQK